MRHALLLITFAACAPRAAPDRAGVDALDRTLDDATRRMDNDALAALWDDDGISLLPNTAPIVGKPAIVAFVARVTASLPGAHMTSFELACHDVEVAGDWASEWCTEHQVVAIPSQPTFDGRGVMLFVLHRGADGRWRLHREMWNPAAP